jgi:hypothetical protein
LQIEGYPLWQTTYPYDRIETVNKPKAA